MAEPFENPQESKVKDEAVVHPSPEERLKREADKLAEKGNKAVKEFDRDNSVPFSR